MIEKKINGSNNKKNVGKPLRACSSFLFWCGLFTIGSDGFIIKNSLLIINFEKIIVGIILIIFSIIVYESIRTKVIKKRYIKKQII